MPDVVLALDPLVPCALDRRGALAADAGWTVYETGTSLRRGGETDIAGLTIEDVSTGSWLVRTTTFRGRRPDEGVPSRGYSHEATWRSILAHAASGQSTGQ